MKRKFFVGIALGIAVAAAFGVWRMLARVPSPPEAQAPAPVAPTEPPQPQALPSMSPSAKPVLSATPTFPPVREPALLSPSSSAELVKCIPSLKSRTPEIRTLDDAWKEVAASQGGIVERTELWKNLHLQLPSGEKRRLRLTPWERGDAGPNASKTRRMRLQVFKEDAEGLPVPTHLTREEELNPTPDIIKKHTADGRETYRDAGASVRFKSGSGAEIQEENGHVRLLQLSGPEASIGCAIDETTREADCQCLSKP